MASLLIAAALLIPSVAAQAATERAKAAAQVERGSARLVLEWQRPVDYAVTRTGAYIFVRFSRPFAGQVEPARTALGRYLAELRLAGGGRVLVMRVAGEPRFAHQRRGNTIVLTWIGARPAKKPSPDENPTDSDDPQPTRATVAPSVAPRAPDGAEPKSPSAIRQEKPSRPAAAPEMRAEPPASPKTGVSAPKSPSAVRPEQPSRPAVPPEMRAERPANPKTAEAAPKSPSAVPQERPARPAAPPAWQAEQPAGPRTGAPTLRTPMPASEQTPARPSAPPPERAAQPSGPVTDGPSPKAPAPKSPGSEVDATPPRPAAPEQRADRPAQPEANAALPPAPAAPRAEKAKPAPSVVKAPDAAPPKAEIRPVPEARIPPEAPLEPPIMPAISPTLTVTSDSVETRIALAWPEPVAAAVFRHGDHIWMVFPRREAFDLQKSERLLGPGVDRLVRIEHAQATVLAVRVQADIRARVAYERSVWTVALKRERAAPALPEVKLMISRNGVDQVAVPLPGAESPIRIVMPKIGSVLHVVPSRATAAAGGERAFVTFRILPALQGGIVEALADGITVGAESGAMTIRRSGGLLLSNGATPGSAQHGQ